MLEENTKKSPILEVEGLTVRRADGAALLEDVSLTVNAGEILGLVGESSAGKSMIGNAVAGLLPAGVVRTGGRIALEGREIQNLRPEEIRRIRGPEIGMILQDPLGSLNPRVLDKRRKGGGKALTAIDAQRIPERFLQPEIATKTHGVRQRSHQSDHDAPRHDASRGE